MNDELRSDLVDSFLEGDSAEIEALFHSDQFSMYSRGRVFDLKYYGVLSRISHREVH
jgi:hypothetical protein